MEKIFENMRVNFGKAKGDKIKISEEIKDIVKSEIIASIIKTIPKLKKGGVDPIAWTEISHSW
ncbi:hypothetical protein LCGC14_1534450 [marine sediment metagenome]|uniref:Uncharacterized protein n=1 Tax=marine sediment metagenome TaxID=412755 RepID=A0A0F9LAQ0_9ZZZZ